MVTSVNFNVAMHPNGDVARFQRDSLGVVTGLIDSSGVVQSGTATVATVNDLPLASDNSGSEVFVSDIELYFRSDGTSWRVLNGYGTLKNDAISVTGIAPATTFTSVTPSDSITAPGTQILLSSAGAHGLTSAVATAGNKGIYVSGGAGWTVGMHEVKAVAVDTSGTTFEISGTYNGAMGTPTIALVGDNMVLKTVEIPPLTINGALDIQSSWETSIGTADKKRLKIKLNGSEYLNVERVHLTRETIMNAITIMNRGSLSSQVGFCAKTADGGYGDNSSVFPTSTINTAIATTLTFIGNVEADNQFVMINALSVRLTG